MTTNDSSRKNFVRSDLDQPSIEAIRRSLNRLPGDYPKNLRSIKEFDWQWQKGSTETAITYADGSIDVRTNSNPPPTRACHDIAHFIAALNGTLEWDYMQTINHLCEFNAVAIECMMTYCSHSVESGAVPDHEQQAQSFFNHMKWFSEEYYKIPKRHPGGKEHTQLILEFTEAIKPELLSRYFGIFYEVWSIENIIGGPEFNLSVNMTSDIDCEFPRIETMLRSQLDCIGALIRKPPKAPGQVDS